MRYEDPHDPEHRPAIDHGTVLDVDGHMEVSFLLPDRQEAVDIKLMPSGEWLASIEYFWTPYDE